MRKLFLIAIVLFIAVSVNNKAEAQCVDSTEIQWTVNELFDFHDVIADIWHNAFPEKDFTKMKGYVGAVKEHMQKINDAKLPGIVKEKETKWKEGLVKFNASADEYYNAMESGNEQTMLDAAEKLHAEFEFMVRVLKPVTKSVDEFHKLLYVVYHKYLPAKDYDGLTSVIDDLVKRAEEVTKTTLPSRLSAKQDEFNQRAKELYESTIALKDVLNSKDGAKIDSAVETMHGNYEKIEQMF